MPTCGARKFASEWLLLPPVCSRGASWGPLLFTIFINTLPESLSPGSQAALYADDSKVYRPVTSLVDSMALQQDLNNLEVWSSKNSIQFNPPKCKILTVTRKRNFHTNCHICPKLTIYIRSTNQLYRRYVSIHRALVIYTVGQYFTDSKMSCNAGSA